MSAFHRLTTLLAVALCSLDATGSSSPPNIVVILADDLGYGDVRCLSPTSNLATPHIDRLANEGMTFTDSHSPSAVCTPTRYGLLTGRYCWRTRLKSGVLGGYSPPLLEPGRATIADFLKEEGYRTAAVGKWHLGMSLPLLNKDAKTSQWAGDPGIDFQGTITDGPTHHGFDTYFGVSASLDMAPYVYIRDDRFSMVPDRQQKAMKFPYFVRQGPRSSDFEIDAVLDRLIEEAGSFIRESAAKQEPFFLYLPLTAPHKPTMPHERFKGQTSLGEYGDFIAQVDWSLGQVMEALEESESAENTLIVFTSDNGSYMHRFEDPDRSDHVEDSKVQGYREDVHRANGPFRGTKADIWEAGHRVPFFVRWPGQIEPGSLCTQTICHTDLFATFADILQAPLSDDRAEDSCSLLPMMRGLNVPRPAPVVHHSASGMFALRKGPWKLVFGNGSGGRQKPKGKPFEKPYQLFDLSRDLGERHDVAAENEDVVKAMTEELERLRQSGRSASNS